MKDYKPFNDNTADEAAKCLRVIAHPVRINILAVLLNREVSVGELAEMLNLTQPAASEHLRTLESRGILKKERRGKKVFYTVAMKQVSGIINCVREKQ